MQYIEMTVEEAIKVLQKSKGKKVLVAIQNLENDNVTPFFPKLKSDCFLMIKEAETISSANDEFVRQLRLFTEKQRDLLNIDKIGLQKIILLK